MEKASPVSATQLLTRASAFAAFAAQQAATLSEQIDHVSEDEAEDLMAYLAAWQTTAVSASRFVAACTEAEQPVDLNEIVSLFALAPEGWDSNNAKIDQQPADIEDSVDKTGLAFAESPHSQMTPKHAAIRHPTTEESQRKSSIKDRFHWLLNHEGDQDDVDKADARASNVIEDVRDAQCLQICSSTKLLHEDEVQDAILSELQAKYADPTPNSDQERDDVIRRLELTANQLRAEEGMDAAQHKAFDPELSGKSTWFKLEEEESSEDCESSFENHLDPAHESKRGSIVSDLEKSSSLMYWQLPSLKTKCQQRSKKRSPQKLPSKASRSRARCPDECEVKRNATAAARHDQLHADAILREQRRERARAMQQQPVVCRPIDDEHIACLHEDADMRQMRLLEAQKEQAEKLLEEDLEHLAIANQASLEVDPAAVKMRIECLHADGHRRQLQKLKAQRLSDEQLQQQARGGAANAKAPKEVEVSVARMCTAHLGKYERWEAERKRREEEEVRQIQQMSIHAAVDRQKLRNRHEQLYADHRVRTAHQQQLLEEKILKTEQMLNECSVHRHAAMRTRSAEHMSERKHAEIQDSEHKFERNVTATDAGDTSTNQDMPPSEDFSPTVKPRKLLTLSMMRKKAKDRKVESKDGSREHGIAAEDSREHGIPEDASTTCPESDDGHSFSVASTSTSRGASAERHHKGRPPPLQVRIGASSKTQLPLSPSNLRKLEKAYGKGEEVDDKIAPSGSHLRQPSSKARLRRTGELLRNQVQKGNASDCESNSLQNLSQPGPEQGFESTHIHVEEKTPKRILRKAGLQHLASAQEKEVDAQIPVERKPQISAGQAAAPKLEQAQKKRLPEGRNPQLAAEQAAALKSGERCVDFAAANASFAEQDKQFKALFSLEVQESVFKNFLSRAEVQKDGADVDLAAYLPQ